MHYRCFRAEIRDKTTLTHQADNQNLDDSADFCYGTNNLDSKSYDMFVENERANFKLLLQKVCNIVTHLISLDNHNDCYFSRFLFLVESRF